MLVLALAVALGLGMTPSGVNTALARVWVAGEDVAEREVIIRVWQCLDEEVTGATDVDATVVRE